MSKTTNKKPEIIQEKNITQAILIADNFNSNLTPLTDEMPVVREAIFLLIIQ